MKSFAYVILPALAFGCLVGIALTLAQAAAAQPAACDPSRPLHERLRATHWRWFEGERMADCDADVLVEAADALETCEGSP